MTTVLLLETYWSLATPAVAYSRRRGGWGVQLPLSVCLSVRAPKGKRLELSTPKSVEISTAGTRLPLTLRSKGQGQGIGYGQDRPQLDKGRGSACLQLHIFSCQ